MDRIEPTMSTEPDIRASVDHLFRRRAGQLVATLTRILGFQHLDLVEDVVQDALVQALRRWPHHGVPEDPGAWILRVAKNRALDVLRHRGMRRDKTDAVERALSPEPERADREAFLASELRDDQLRMIFACCDPAISRDAQVALVLKTVGGFGTEEIARAFLAPVPRVAQRLVRAKRTLRGQGTHLEIPPAAEMPARLDVVLEAVYLMFNEGYSAFAGEDLVRHELCQEALRLAELLATHRASSTPTVHALAALLCFQAARLPGRVDVGGTLMTLAEQDRDRWDVALRDRGLDHLRRAARGDAISTYHLEAEIAACHTVAAREEDTDWRRILEAYDALLAQHPSPVVALNRAVALLQVEGPAAALAALDAVADHPALDTYLPAWAARAEVLARLDRRVDAAVCYDRALELAGCIPVRRYLELRRRRLAVPARVSP